MSDDENVDAVTDEAPHPDTHWHQHVEDWKGYLARARAALHHRHGEHQ
jgi:hypothetical protein